MLLSVKSFNPIYKAKRALFSLVSDLVGKTVLYPGPEKEQLAGRVKSVSNDIATIEIAVPDIDGSLIVCDTTTVCPTSEIKPYEGVVIERKLKRFENIVELQGEGVKFKKFLSDKKMVTVTEGSDATETDDIVEDYLNVTISGYASTFQNVTPSDREGDYVKKGAFTDTITDFMRNPVMLADHENKVTHLIGAFTQLTQDAKGLFVQARISNSPDEFTKSIRFKLAEGFLKALSIGGFLIYSEDGRGIEKVNLYEITLTPVPMNPDALISVRSLDLKDCAKAFAAHRSKNLTLKTK